MIAIIITIMVLELKVPPGGDLAALLLSAIAYYVLVRAIVHAEGLRAAPP